MSKVYIKHSLSKTRLYRIWHHMKVRCNNPNFDHYEYYGGKGITVCDEWEHDFMAFRDWAIANGYSNNLTIDRINNDGNYEPGNCRWATQKEQANNKQQGDLSSRGTNHMIAFHNEIHTMAQWSEITGIDQNTISERLRRGKSIERALAPLAPTVRRSKC